MWLPTALALVVSYYIAFPPNLQPNLPVHHPIRPVRTLTLYPEYQDSMVRIILTGATGMAGSEALRQLLLHPAVAHVTVLSRRDLPSTIPTNPKLSVELHKDFLSYPPELLRKLNGYDGVIWDLGTSSIGMNESEYSLIHVDYPLAAARAFAPLAKPGRKLVFALLSGQGASQDEQATSRMFGRVKGRAEKALAALSATVPTLTTYSFRPALINPVNPLHELSALKKSAYFVLPFIRSLAEKTLGVVETDVLAAAMLQAVLKGSSGTLPGWEGKGLPGDEGTFNNTEIIKLARTSWLAGPQVEVSQIP